MDDIAAYRRAIRFGEFHVSKPADLTAEVLVAMALENDRQSAWAILQECNRLLRVPKATDEGQHPIVRFFDDFDYGRRITNNPNGRSILEEGKRFVTEHAGKLGPAYATYLSACFDTALDHHEEFVIDPEGNCPEIPDWLGQAFHVTPYKSDGQPVDLELDADMLDAMHFIYKALQGRSDRGGTALEMEVRRFIDSEAPELPPCIERLIKLKGYPQATEYLPALRTNLASFILGEIERLRGSDHWRQFAAGNIVLRCGDACMEQVELLISRTDISDEDRRRLLERRAILRDYSSESLQRHNRSGNATGLARLHRKHKDTIHGQIKRSANVRNREETDRFLAEIETDKAKQRAFNEPACVKQSQSSIRRTLETAADANLLSYRSKRPGMHSMSGPTCGNDSRKRCGASPLIRAGNDDMIVSESGVVVGTLDEGTLELSGVRSTRLQQLVDDWRENGFTEPAAAEIPDDFPEPKPDCAMTYVTIPFDEASAGFLALKLAVAGFDVQRD